MMEELEPEVPKQTAIEAEMALLSEAIQGNSECTRELCQHLSTVVTAPVPPVKAEDVEKADGPQQCDMEVKLRQFTERINQTIGDVRSTIERLRL